MVSWFICKHGLSEDPLDDDEHEIELILTQKDVHDKVQSKESVLLQQDSNNLTPAATHIIETIENITIAKYVSMPSLNDSSTFSLHDIQMSMGIDDISTESSSFFISNYVFLNYYYHYHNTLNPSAAP